MLKSMINTKVNISKILGVTLIILFVATNVSAQFFQDLDDDDDFSIQLRGERKSAAKAILFSSIFPGAGHFYSNPKTIGTYLFPILEIGFWVGYFHFDNKGKDIEKEYMTFADDHYSRNYFHKVKDKLIDHSQSSSIYNKNHFLLDPTNTQHFYEDIGKYNKYIFGWEDWYLKYVNPDTKEIRWEFNDEGIWLGNYPWDGVGGSFERPYSSKRAEYIQMRRDAQQNFDRKQLMTFGFALNRIISSLDAVRVTNRYNTELRYGYNIKLNFQPIYVQNNLTPTLSLVVNY